MTENIAELMDVFFNGRKPSSPPTEPKTTDKPNIVMFMLQLLHHYADMADADGMRWNKTYRKKESGKQYVVTVEIREEAA